MKKLLAAIAFVLTCTGCSTTEVIPEAYRVRKSVSELSAAQKQDIVSAILKLKTVKSPYDSTLSYYDQFVKWHLDAFRCDIGAAHMGPAFLPWHRQYLLMFEKALNEMQPASQINLPYWDWSDATQFSKMFADDFMGGGGDSNDNYAVTSGPFRKGLWTNTVLDPNDIAPIQFDFLTRGFGTYSAGVFPNADNIQYLLERPEYDVAPWDHHSDSSLSFRNYLEGWRGCYNQEHCVLGWMEPERCKTDSTHSSKMHNVVHLLVGGVWKDSVGGTITAMTSPNDPAFWFLHANVDRMWAAWEKRHPNDYKPVTGGPAGHNLRDRMWPYSTVGLNITPENMQTARKQGYEYDRVP